MQPIFEKTYERKTKTYSVTETNKWGVKFIYSCKKHELKNKQNIFKRRNEFQESIPIVTPQFIGLTSQADYLKSKPKKKIKRDIDLVEQFYKSLPKEFFYVIDTFWLRLFDEDNDLNYLVGLDKDKKKIKYEEQIELARFFIVEKKYIAKLEEQLEEDEEVMQYKFEKINNYQSFLMIIPNYKFHHNRCGFNVKPWYGKPATYMEVKRHWHDVDDYGLQMKTISIGEING